VRKLIVSEFVSLDGVMEAPGGEPGYAHSGWVGDFMGPEQLQYKLNEVREAEALVMSVLRERGHPLTERDLPQEMQRAHRLGYTSKDKTEGMRQALLHYRAVMVRMVGPEDRAQREQRRRELA